MVSRGVKIFRQLWTWQVGKTPSTMLYANVEWKDGKINIGKEFGMDGFKVTNFHLRFGLKL